MFPQRLDSPLAYSVATALLDGFNRHYQLFRAESSRAKHRFETADWHGQQRAQRERIEFYDLRVSEAVARLEARVWVTSHPRAVITDRPTFDAALAAFSAKLDERSLRLLAMLTPHPQPVAELVRQGLLYPPGLARTCAQVSSLLLERNSTLFRCSLTRYSFTWRQAELGWLAAKGFSLANVSLILVI